MRLPESRVSSWRRRGLRTPRENGGVSRWPWIAPSRPSYTERVRRHGSMLVALWLIAGAAACVRMVPSPDDVAPPSRDARR